MRFLADMGVGMRVVRHLREAGHDAIHLAEQQLQRLPDRDIFTKARAEDRIVLTFDLDFADIAAAGGNALRRDLSAQGSERTNSHQPLGGSAR